MKSILLFIFLFTFSFYGQESGASKVLLIDSICSSINSLKPNEYKTYQSSGIIEKKKFVFFYKTIGSFHVDGFFINDKLLKVNYTEFLIGSSANEVFYFKDNKLIKFERKFFNKNISNDVEIIPKAYFENDVLIHYSTNKFWNFNALKTLQKANQLKEEFIEDVNFFEQFKF